MPTPKPQLTNPTQAIPPTPTMDLLEAATTVLAIRETLKQINHHLEEFRKEAIRTNSWSTNPAWGNPQRITRPDQAGRLTTSDYLDYHRKYTKIAHTHGYRMPNGICPTTDLQEALRAAEDALLDAHAPTRGYNSQSHEMLSNPTLRGSAINLTLKHARNTPGFDPNAITKLNRNLLTQSKARHLN